MTLSTTIIRPRGYYAERRGCPNQLIGNAAVPASPVGLFTGGTKARESLGLVEGQSDMVEPLRILHFEDQRYDAELVKAQLAAQGVSCVVQWVADRASFLAALEQGNIDLILSDFVMPGFDGLAALVLAREKRPDLPFIFVSGAIGEDRAIEILKQGATDYVLKERLSRLGPAVRRAAQEARDRAERQRAEETLRRSEAYFRALVENTSDLVVIVESLATIRYVSPSVRQILGYEQQEIIGRSPSEFVHPEDRSISADFFSRIHQQPGVQHRVEFRFQHRDGRVVILEGVVSDLLGDPAVGSIVVNARDVTDRRRAETALQAINHRLEETLTRLQATQQELNRELEVERQLRTELHRLSVELRGVQESERGRIARELHDGVAQTLSGVLLHLDLLNGTIKNLPQAKELVGEIKNMVTLACTDVQDLVWKLRPAMLDDLGLADAIRGLVANVTRSTQLEILLDFSENLPVLSPAVETALYRIVQEALSNVVQHAYATQATVRFEIAEGLLFLTVADNGRGLNPAAPSSQALSKIAGTTVGRRGIGLWSMQERAEEVGGTFSLRSTPGQGLIILVTVPIISSEESQEV